VITRRQDLLPAKNAGRRKTTRSSAPLKASIYSELFPAGRTVSAKYSLQTGMIQQNPELQTAYIEEKEQVTGQSGWAGALSVRSNKQIRTLSAPPPIPSGNCVTVPGIQPEVPTRWKADFP